MLAALCAVHHTVILWRPQEGGLTVRRQLLEEANAHHLLLHSGRLEALTCPTTIMHRHAVMRQGACTGVGEAVQAGSAMG